ncbi:hypothetical protein BURK1_00713 [Burkholderiales bacterium]|nr:hypothetical protein BURK1_00713 [Burkholderiales bacterium]
MGKLLFWIIVAFIVLLAVRLVGSAQARKRRDRDAAQRVTGPMVRCTKCGVFLPKADAVPVADGYRCREPACLPPS